MFGAHRRIDDHILECRERHRRLMAQIDAHNSETRDSFAAMRAERDRMHAENGERVDRIDRTLMKVALSIVTAFLLAMLSQHF